MRLAREVTLSPNMRTIALLACLCAGASAGCDTTDTVEPVAPPERGGRRIAFDLGLTPLDWALPDPLDAAPDGPPPDGQAADAQRPDSMGFDATPDDGQNGQ